jgi:hypothetical protein
MSGSSNFPTALDDDSSLYDVIDGTTAIIAGHHNNTKEAVKRIEAKVGVHNTSAPTSLDYRLGHPTLGHLHNGASGQGPKISASSLANVPPVRHVMSQGLSTGWSGIGSAVLGPIVVPLTLQIEALAIQSFRGPTGGTTVLDVNVNGTSIWYASQGHRPVHGPTTGLAVFQMGTYNTFTAPSGSMLTVDVDTSGTNGAFDRLGITFIFRE